ncbi:MAG TPA: hypothetical protein VM686_34110 [Polyangiaceae bacterium]|nr:hypothetical protein [Polyangiaceae bacterium]
MNRHRLDVVVALVVLLLTSLVWPGLAHAHTDADAAPGMPKIFGVAPDVVVRGSPVVVSGEGFPRENEAILLELGGVFVGHPSHIAEDGKSFTFVVPRSIVQDGQTTRVPLGQQLLRATIEYAPEGMTATPFAAGRLRVVGENQAALRLLKAEPAFMLPDAKRMVLSAEGLGGAVDDYVLLRDGREMPLCAAAPCAGGLLARLVSAHQLEVEGPFDDSWHGKRQLALRAGDTESGPLEVGFSAYTSSEVRQYAIAASAAFLVFMLFVFFAGSRPHRIGDVTYRLRGFLLDTETDTYSLSKLQFYLWTVAALFAYCYLSLSRTLAQGQLEIADIPKNLPGIIAISAGTAAVSVGITAARGPKAAGPMYPSLGDMICTGGVVSPERFQFLLWTLVGIAAFLFSVVQADAASLTELPALPDGLLMLSGVSAAGYLAGKIVRAPGPIIDEVIPSEGSLMLTVLGRNLSLDATFEIDGKVITDMLDLEQHADHRPELVERESRQDSSDLAKSLRLHLDLTKIDEAWLEEQPRKAALELKFTIINRDGQRAECPFKIDEELRAKLVAPTKPRGPSSESPRTSPAE